MTLPFSRTNKNPSRGCVAHEGTSPLSLDSPTPSGTIRAESPSTINAHQQAQTGTLFQFSKRALYFFGALILIPWAIVLLLLFTRSRTNDTPSTRAASNDSSPAPLTSNSSPYDDYVHQCRPGPWGELQYSRLVIEPPDEFILEEYITPQPLNWVFPGYDRQRVHDLFASAGLTDVQFRELTAPDAVEVSDDAVIVRPTFALALNLSRESRAKIYSALSRHPQNLVQHEPFRFRADSVDEWFSDCGLSPETISLAKRVLYQRGSSILCSDHDVLLSQIQSRAERLRLVRTLARKSTLLVKLRVSPQDDVAALADYWGRGSRRKDMRALLNSISHRPQGITLDIAHLLPSFARSRLFTYPPPSDDPRAASHDCHWTSLNFFNDQPDERYADIEAVRASFEQDHEIVTNQPRLGDIIVFVTPSDEVIHSCVFVADDIVFTKNGASDAMPWILMNLPDVVAFYPADPPLTLRIFRRKSG
jgi:hypothetical protein